MRTTIRIDDELYRELKARAARRGATVASVIEDVIRAGLAAETARHDAPPPDLPTYGSRGTLPGIDLADTAALRAAMDEGEPADALR